MLGSQANPLISVKAAECRGLLEFVVQLLKSNQLKCAVGKSNEELERNKLEASLLIGAGESALQFEHLLIHNQSRRQLDACAQTQMLESYHRFNVLFHRTGIQQNPKSHQMYHMLYESKMNGNPSFYHSYANETLNGRIARIARTCHRKTWTESVFRKLHLMNCVPTPWS